ncbi:DNA-3-methyladenine glycosylase I [Methyloradius palustris]|uniref:DNA-3-methyladenine glycosylase I n=1 Tax=Methyloradius palustris TaxID=2778876 RepID=A0A8D5G133_9PROT|nr:DNA-3-methyladenine glycosylase I [Methyloradius palustris]BCM24173.1 DNA-3-methyladenine glycosylase I [Methyloradius palustris]
MTTRCAWPKSPLDIVYHDTEWGVPVHDDRKLFEFLILEGAQAGLSWSTILKKREHYRLVFDDFEPAVVAQYTDDKSQALLTDAGIVRNRLKIASTINNAQKFLQIQAEFGSFDAYLWRFLDGKPIQSHWQAHTQLPARTVISDQLSKDLLKRGFKFVGTTICYAFMQAVGMVNDHSVDCFRYKELMPI